jgi:hypothetical protein
VKGVGVADLRRGRGGGATGRAPRYGAGRWAAARRGAAACEGQ